MSTYPIKFIPILDSMDIYLKNLNGIIRDYRCWYRYVYLSHQIYTYIRFNGYLPKKSKWNYHPCLHGRQNNLVHAVLNHSEGQNHFFQKDAYLRFNLITFDFNVYLLVIENLIARRLVFVTKFMAS